VREGEEGRGGEGVQKNKLIKFYNNQKSPVKK